MQCIHNSVMYERFERMLSTTPEERKQAALNRIYDKVQEVTYMYLSGKTQYHGKVVR